MWADRHQEIELALGRLHPGNGDVEIAGRAAPELFLRRLVAFDIGRAADVVALQSATLQRAQQSGVVSLAIGADDAGFQRLRGKAGRVNQKTAVQVKMVPALRYRT